MPYRANNQENGVLKMSSAYIIQEKCPQNHSCPALPQCPTNAIIQDGYNAPKVMEDKCIVCGKCVEVCPKKAFQIPE